MMSMVPIDQGQFTVAERTVADQSDLLLTAAVAQRVDDPFDAAAGGVDRLQGRVLSQHLFRHGPGDIRPFMTANRLRICCPLPCSRRQERKLISQLSGR